MRLTLALAGAVAALGLAACQTTPAPLPPPLPAFQPWSEDFAARWMRLSPERSTASQYFGGAEQEALDSQLGAASAARRQAERALATEGLAMLERQLASPLPAPDRRAAQTIRWSLQRSLDAAPHERLGFAFNQLSGL